MQLQEGISNSQLIGGYRLTAARAERSGQSPPSQENDGATVGPALVWSNYATVDAAWCLTRKLEGVVSCWVKGLQLADFIYKFKVQSLSASGWAGEASPESEVLHWRHTLPLMTELKVLRCGRTSCEIDWDGGKPGNYMVQLQEAPTRRDPTPAWRMLPSTFFRYTDYVKPGASSQARAVCFLPEHLRVMPELVMLRTFKP